METSNHLKYINAYRIGLVLNAMSMAIYLLGTHQSEDFSLFSQTFFLNYGISIAYLVVLLVRKARLESPNKNISYACWINVVILFTISAFSLNREMNVFARFPAWLNIYTILSVPLFLIFPYFKKMPQAAKALVLFLSGASLTLSIYMFLYLMPLLPLSCIALLALGISIHSFVPAAWLWILFDFIFEKTGKIKLKLWIIPGALLPVIFLIFYLHKWYSLQLQIKDDIAEQNIKLDHRLPDAIYLAQKLPADALTDEILMATFKAQRFWNNGFMFNEDGRNRYHNPLSTIGIGLFGDIGLDHATVESILNIRKNYRHNTTDKLWTGTSLATAAVSTNIQVFPKYRLAYHDKTIIIHNDPNKQNDEAWFTSQTQEALYTFHVPEGSIVTSLSLWINGKEHQSRLSTTQKADSAYKKIVGVERRDPAVVHWKEGNTVTVNIFPCTPNEDRTFKIGFTTPLKVTGDALCLENIWFEGPDSRHAREVTQVLVESDHQKAKALADGFETQASGNYIYKGDYMPYWQIKFEKEALSANTFCFGGFKYAMEEARPKPLKADLKNVFLDITNQWTKEEFDNIVHKLGSKNLYAWLPEQTRITAGNKDLVWENTSRNQFSVPFIYDITTPGNSLIITKTSYQSPILSDLKQSDLAEKFTTYLTADNHKLSVLNIGSELSPFWRSFRELRLINYEACSKDEAIAKTLSGILNTYEEDSCRTVICDSQLAIRKIENSDSLAKSAAPDHLLRLFAYNDLLRQIGPKYFEKEKYEETLFREAEEAYVVSPVTSMIVLENDFDYNRMGIKQNINTVGNAGVLGGGAVPEPHEWLLIALIAFIIGRHLLKQKQLSVR